MKFTKNFILTMKNFARIHSSMYFRKGTVQSTGLFPSNNSSSPIMFARANTDVEIESPFGILDLSKFLASLSLFGNDIPEATLTDTHIYIGDDLKKIGYALTNPDFISYAKNPDIFTLSEPNVKINLTKENLSSIIKMKSLFDLEYLTIKAQGGKIIASCNNGSSGGNDGTIFLSNSDKEFKATIKTSNFNLYEDMDYTLSVAKKGYLHFKNDVFEYFIPCEGNLSEL